MRAIVKLLTMLALCGAFHLGNQEEPSLAFVRQRGLQLGPQQLKKPLEPHSAVFIHAVAGIFTYRRKDRAGQTWGHGKEILLEMLETMYRVPKFVDHLDCIYICMLGAINDIIDAREAVIAAFVSRNRTIARKPRPRKTRIGSRFQSDYWPMDNVEKIRFVLEGENKFLWEFPTLSLLQYYASTVHSETKLLYLHTKGVRRNAPTDRTIHQWRRYMMYWLVETDICSQALDKGFYSCGALKKGGSRGHYGGNFWWVKSGFLSHRRPRIESIDWSVNKTGRERFGAEEYLLKGASLREHEDNHYCVHHTHQDMNMCPTPPRWYRLDAPSHKAKTNKSYEFRKNGNCFSASLMPNKHRSKNKEDWCFHDGFPTIV